MNRPTPVKRLPSRNFLLAGGNNVVIQFHVWYVSLSRQGRLSLVYISHLLPIEWMSQNLGFVQADMWCLSRW